MTLRIIKENELYCHAEERNSHTLVVMEQQEVYSTIGQLRVKKSRTSGIAFSLSLFRCCSQNVDGMTFAHYLSGTDGNVRKKEDTKQTPGRIKLFPETGQAVTISRAYI